MAITKRKRTVYTNEIERYPFSFAVNLNKGNMMEIKLPEHYAELFETLGADEVSEALCYNYVSPSAKKDFAHVEFSSMTEFDSVIENLNKVFLEKREALTTKKVIVVHTKMVSNPHDINTIGLGRASSSLEFRFSVGIQIGNMVYSERDFSLEFGEDREDMSNYTTRRLCCNPTVLCVHVDKTFDCHSFHEANEIVLDWTKDRELFFRGFEGAFDDMIFRIFNFLVSVEKGEEGLTLVDTTSPFALLGQTPSSSLDDEAIETEAIEE